MSQYNEISRALYVLIAEYVDVDEDDFYTAISCLGINNVMLYARDLGITIIKNDDFRVIVTTVDDNRWFVAKKVRLLFELITRGKENASMCKKNTQSL